MFFFFSCYGDHRDLHVLPHACPTRRSSDLGTRQCTAIAGAVHLPVTVDFEGGYAVDPDSVAANLTRLAATGAIGCNIEDQRSEEHTSELQSLMRISYAVFCLKKIRKQETIGTNIYI